MRTVFQDVFLNLLLGFLAIVILMYPFINDPTEEEQAQKNGNISVTIEWREPSSDVDLWVKAPGDRPVGYSRRSGKVFNLLRDDLGAHDFIPGNYENAWTRGYPPGEYIVNVHCYRCTGLPIKVRVESYITISTRRVKLFSKFVTLTHVGQELTVHRFTINEEGHLLPDLTNNIPIKLRGM